MESSFFLGHPVSRWYRFILKAIFNSDFDSSLILVGGAHPQIHGI
jgi:hypothetical protein